MQPFLKWAGGKRWLFTPEFNATLPPFNRYVEPFVGGGAGFFSIAPESAILSDINSDLIELYGVVRDEPRELACQMAVHQKSHCGDYYYAVRAHVPPDRLGRAARMLYLNRSCWNGLYRLNRSGNFNVPIGTKSKVYFGPDEFDSYSDSLQRAELRTCDFEATINEVRCGDLLFIDPPYTVKHNMNGFVKYNEVIFKWSDQERLKGAVERAVSRGAKVLLTNANHASVRDLYDGVGISTNVDRHSVISGLPGGRSQISELVLFA